MNKKYLIGLFAIVLCFGFSSFIISDSHALKHNYSSLNFSDYNPFFSSDSAWGSGTGISVSYPFSDRLSNPHLPNQSVKSGGTPCYQSSSDALHFVNASYSIDEFLQIPKNYALPGITLSSPLLCQSVERNTFYEYDSFRIAPVNDSSHATALTISDVFGSDSHYMYPFSLPLTFNPETVGATTSGRQYHFHIEFTSSQEFYTSDSSGNLASSWSNQPVNFYVFGVYSDSNANPIYNGFSAFSQTYTFDNASFYGSYCTNLFNSVDSKKLQSDCYWTSPHDFELVTFMVNIGNLNTLQPVWYNQSDYVFFGDFYVITDNDNTPGDDASLPMTGSNVESSPGYAETTGESYYDSLVNLFHFDLLNPFAPLFTMFTDNTQCASIPIIAGMLNATESSYCPWFPASVRNVLTPVLGLASVMLLFGFFVRWLGSASGNNFEDSSRHIVIGKGKGGNV